MCSHEIAYSNDGHLRVFVSSAGQGFADRPNTGETMNNQSRSFKILALDGGGFKGLYTACILHEIEKFNKPLASHFDLLSGTSVGGLIALALAAGKTAEEIKAFFLEKGETIFPQGSWLERKRRVLGQFIGGGKYSDDGLRTALGS